VRLPQITSGSDRSLVVIQRNPKSGSGRGRGELILLIRELKTHGLKVRMFPDRAVMDDYLRGLSAPASLRCIVAAGGDGTVADLVNRHPGVPIAILPLGTENLLARYLGIRRCGRSLARMILQANTRVLDSAIANGRRFLLMMSVGVDADIVDSLHRCRTGNIRRMSYVVPSLRAFLTSQPRVFRAVSADGTCELRGSHIIVSNAPVYGFALPFCPGAAPDDGLLDVRSFTGKTRWQILWHAVKLKTGFPVHDGEVQRICVSSITLEVADQASTGQSGVTQCDGDPGPALPVRIEIDPRSLTVIVP
jgi:diacylglycerol kinase (ATP)